MSSDGRPLPVISARQRLVLLTAVLLVGAALRLIGLDNTTPPGLEHDEVAHWLINQEIVAGNHAIYFTEAYGHEALYHYLQTAVTELVGDHALGLRLPSAYLGLLLVAISYALGRRLFGWPVALAATAFLAVLFWPVFYSRLALRAIALPVFSGLAAVAWWRGWAGPNETPEQVTAEAVVPGNATAWLALAGVLAGLSLHTYMAARAVPIFFALFTLYLLLFHRRELRARGWGVVAFFVAYALVALPLVLYLRNHPGAEFRISEVDAPLRALQQGDLLPIISNAWRILLMFGVRGDPLWRQGIAGQPVFGPVMALLFYAGVLLALWRIRDARYGFLVLWLATAVLPSVVTIDAPSTIRIVNLLPVLMLFPMLVIHKGAQLSTGGHKFSTRQWITAIVLVLSALWCVQLWRTVDGLWRTWPANDEVRFVWQADLTEAAAFLDASAESGPVAVGGWTPDTMDPPTMELSLRRDDLSLRFFDPAQSLVLPYSPDGKPIRIVRPGILPFSPLLEEYVSQWSVPVEAGFALYEVIPPVAVAPFAAKDVLFGDEIRLLGFDPAGPCMPGQTEPCTIITTWRVEAKPDGDRRFFLHGVDSTHTIVSQDDKLGVPAEGWQVGDIILQQLTLPADFVELRIGVYDPATQERLLTATGEDHVVLP